MSNLVAMDLFEAYSKSKLPMDNGYIVSSFFKEERGLINSRNQSTAQIELKSNLTNNYSFFSSVEFRNDLSDSNRNRVYMKETYIDVYTKILDLRLGKQVILWGKTDGFNPTNNLCPIDYSDILDTRDEEIGIIALNTKFYFKDWEIQWVISPAFQSSIFPSERSRWKNTFPAFLFYNGEYKPIAYFWNTVDFPQNRFKDIQNAFKISKSFNFWDFSISYYNGWNDIPYITSEIKKQQKKDTINVSLNQNYYKHQIIGTDFSILLGKYILRGEGALFFPQKTNIYTPYFQYVLGVERIFRNVIGNKNLHVIAQWIQEIKSSKTEYSESDFNHLFQKNLMTRIEMDMTKDITFSIQGIYSLKYYEYYVRPEFTYNVSDGLNLVVLADVLGGDKSQNGFFSKYRNNNRIQIKLKYSF